MATYSIPSGTTFTYNTDLSGNVTIAPNGGGSVVIPMTHLKQFLGKLVKDKRAANLTAMVSHLTSQTEASIADGLLGTGSAFSQEYEE